MRVIALRWHLSHAVQWSPFWIWESERLSHTSMVMRPIWSTYFPKQNRIQHGWLVLPLKALIWHGRVAQSSVNGSCLNIRLAALFGYAEKRAYGVFFCASQGNACFWTCPLLYERRLCSLLNLSEISAQKQPDFQKFPNRLWWIKSFQADPTPFSAWQRVTVILMINGGFYLPGDCECKEAGDILLVTLWRITHWAPLSSKLLSFPLSALLIL